MAKLLRLEEFEPIAKDFPHGLGADQDLTQFSGDNIAQNGSETFEIGYQAGWEDAAKAANDEKTKLSAEFSHNLQDLGFTFHEARSHVIGSMESLLTALADTLLPDIMAKTIGARILEEVLPLAETAADRPIQIVLPPANISVVEALISEGLNCPFELVEEPSLGVGQVYLRSGKMEKKIDLEKSVLKVKEAIAALVEDNRRGFANG